VFERTECNLAGITERSNRILPFGIRMTFCAAADQRKRKRGKKEGKEKGGGRRGE